MIIDFRSDTVTQPTAKMLTAMMEARVGDDVLGDDLTTTELEEYAADLFGMEAALFCPSGTMTNQIAIKVHTNSPGELICGDLSHIYHYEGGGIGFNAGLSAKLISGNQGRISAEQVASAINPDDVHAPPTQLVSLENTVNKGGGCYYNFNDIMKIKTACDQHQIPLHLDGARLFNALAETPETEKDYGACFDSISICLSKGLGAPIGSLLLGKADFIKKSRRIRKILGGGMRQTGFIAAAGLFALKHHRERLIEDHKLAKEVGRMLSVQNFVKHIEPIETNIIIFEHIERYTTEDLLEKLSELGIKAVKMGQQKIRFVTHLNLPKNTLQIIQEKLPKLK
jgi:threonine aldolase